MKIPAWNSWPKELHVGEETYTVKFVAKIPGMPKDTVGLCDPETHTIFIKKEQTKKQLFLTYIHEVTHAIEFEYDIPIKHKAVYQLETAIGELLLANF